MVHDFRRFPELTNNQMQFYYFDSPHRQITEDFEGVVTRVKDGDTFMVKWSDREFEFPVRFIGTDTPEMSGTKGEEAKQWLKQQIEGKLVRVMVDKSNRVGKYGRLLGRVLSGGQDINEESIRQGLAIPFDRKGEGTIPDFNKELRRHEIK